MIKEAVQFVKEVEESGILKDFEVDFSKKKFIIIETEKKSEHIKYKNALFFEGDKIREWLNVHNHYEEFFKNLDNFIFPKEIGGNKALGGRRGLLTFVPFAFQFRDEIINSLLKRKEDKRNINKKVDNTYKAFSSISNRYKILNNIKDREDLISKIKNIYEIFFKKIKEKFTSENLKEKYINSYVIIQLDKDTFSKLFAWSREYIKIKKSEAKQSAKKFQGECAICKKKRKISYSSFFSSWDVDKIYFNHKTRIKEKPLFICSECQLKLKDFQNILKRFKIKIFPLFIDSSFREKEIKLLNSKTKNIFSYIFEQLKEETSNMDFYLVVNSGGIVFFDYVTNYRWLLGNYFFFFDFKEENRQYRKGEIISNVSRQFIEKKVAQLLDNKDNVKYFGELKGKDNESLTKEYQIRQKIFDFIYRSKNYLTKKDIENLVIFKIEKDIKDPKKKDSLIRVNSKKYLNFLFNYHLIGGFEMNEKSIILNKVKDMKEVLNSGDYDKFDIRDSEEWAYWVGQLAYYLAYQSKSQNKNYALIEPFINRSTTKLIKKTLNEFFEKFKHAINMQNKKFSVVSSKVSDYLIQKSFIDLKIYFYTGVFDDNIFLKKKEV